MQWRWLIIDEISMVSAELLARMGLRCRELVRDLAQSKYAPGSAPRAALRRVERTSGRGFMAIATTTRNFFGGSALGNADQGEQQKSRPHRAWAEAGVGLAGGEQHHPRHHRTRAM